MVVYIYFLSSKLTFYSAVENGEVLYACDINIHEITVSGKNRGKV